MREIECVSDKLSRDLRFLETQLILLVAEKIVTDKITRNGKAIEIKRTEDGRFASNKGSNSESPEDSSEDSSQAPVANDTPAEVSPPGSSPDAPKTEPPAASTAAEPVEPSPESKEEKVEPEVLPEKSNKEIQDSAKAIVENISTESGKIDLTLLEAEVDKEIQSGQIKLPSHDEIVADAVSKIDLDAEANFFNTDIEQLASPENPAISEGIQSSANKVSEQLKSQAKALAEQIESAGDNSADSPTRLEFYNQASKTLEDSGIEISPELQSKILQATKEKYIADYKKKASSTAKSIKNSIQAKSKKYQEVNKKIDEEIAAIKDPNIKNKVQERAKEETKKQAKSLSMQYSWTKDVAEAKEYFSNFGDKVDTWKTVLGTDEKNTYPAQVAAAVFSPAIKIPFDLVKDEIINTAIAAKFVVNTVGNAIALLSEKEESEKIEEKPPEYIVPKKITKESKQIEKQAQKDIKEASKYKEQIAELEQMADDLYQTIYFDYADIQSAGSLEQLEKRYQ